MKIYIPQWPVTVKKVDSENNTQTLADAKFILSQTKDNTTLYYSASGWVTDSTKADRLTTAADGTVAIPNLEYGDYILTEVEAPPGYLCLSSDIPFNLSIGGIITSSDSNVTITEDNSLLLQVQNRAGQRLPDTGGSGTYLYIISGLILMGAAALIYSYINVKNERGER